MSEATWEDYNRCVSQAGERLCGTFISTLSLSGGCVCDLKQAKNHRFRAFMARFLRLGGVI
jgi:hypothetical protein